MSRTQPTTAPDSLEARLAARMAGALTLRSQMLPHDVSERLRVARDQALARARQARLKAGAGLTVMGTSAAGAATLGALGSWWQRVASVMPLVMLVLGLLMIDNHARREQVMAAAEIDALLLSDDLPPAAYSDPGFGEYLRSPPSP